MITAARERIAPLARRTPSESLHLPSGHDLIAKLEIWQITGSFKIRGAANRLAQLSAVERATGVITASAGNHALGVATGAVALGIPATVVVSHEASPAKVAALRRFDPRYVTLVQAGKDYDEAEAHGIQLAREAGRPFVSPYNDPAVIAGQGTIAAELLEDAPDLTTLLIPVGGGGLAAGIGVWAKHVNPTIRLIGVQSEASPSMAATFAAGHDVIAPVGDSLADGLAGNIEPGSITVPLCLEALEQVILVSEAAIRDAVRWLALEQHIIVEGSGAVGVAAILAGAFTPTAGNPIGTILTGRNIAGAKLQGALA
jgi:threonine dehydratase